MKICDKICDLEEYITGNKINIIFNYDEVKFNYKLP